MIERLVDINDTNIMELKKSSKSKMHDEKDGIVLSKLLRGYKKQKSSSTENDSGHDSDTFEDTDYKSLLKIMSSCDISSEKKKVTKQKYVSNYNSVRIESSSKNNESKTSNSKSHKEDDQKIKIKDNVINNSVNKNPDMITLQVKIKKQKSNNSSGSENISKHTNSKKITIINNVSTLENITDKLSEMRLSSDKLNTEKQSVKVNNDQKHKQDNKDKKSNKEKPKKTLLIERGPIRCNINDIRKKIPPYESQIHRNALSGGKVVIQVTPPEDDIIPSTVNKYTEINLNKITQELRKNQSKYSNIINDKIAKDFYTWEEDLNMIMEILEGDQKQIVSASCNFSNERYNKQKEIEKFLADETISTWPNIDYNEGSIEKCGSEVSTDDNVSSPSYTDYNSTVNSPYSDSSVPLTIQMSPYQDQNYLRTDLYNTGNNLSPYSSPMQGFQSPSIDNVDKALYNDNSLYDYNNRSVPSVSRESHSSISSSDSPNFQTQESIFDFLDLNFPIPSNDKDTDCYKLNSSEYTYYNDNSSQLNNTSLILEDLIQIEKNQNIYSNNANSDSMKFKYQSRIESAFNKTINSIKNKFIPIASKEAYSCCLNHNSNAKQALEEIFNKLNEKTRQMICFKVHSIDEDKLMELFDGQLSSWNESLGDQFPRLPLLHATCERLLMRSKTMGKFFEIYVNGHTILDRVLLTCHQSPLVVKYLADCLLRAMPHLPPDSDFIIDKTDVSGNTVLHRGAGRGEQCALALSSLLSLNDLSQSPIFNVNRLNTDGYTPLHIACSRHTATQPGQSCSCLLTAHVLLEHGHADPNIKDGRSGYTPLHSAVNASICGLQLVSLLLKYGAKPLIRSYSGATPLDLAKSSCRSIAKPNIQKQIVELLKKYK